MSVPICMSLGVSALEVCKNVCTLDAYACIRLPCSRPDASKTENKKYRKVCNFEMTLLGVVALVYLPNQAGYFALIGLNLVDFNWIIIP